MRPISSSDVERAGSAVKSPFDSRSSTLVTSSSGRTTCRRATRTIAAEISRPARSSPPISIFATEPPAAAASAPTEAAASIFAVASSIATSSASYCFLKSGNISCAP